MGRGKKMRAIFALVLVLGMALAGVAVYMAQGYMNQTEAALTRATEINRRTGKLVQVYAVKKAMKFGDPLTRDDVQAVYVQESRLPAGTFAYVDPAQPASGTAESDQMASALFPADEERPRYLLRSMEANEIVLASRVTEPGRPASLTGKLAQGMRAFQVKVDTSSGVQGFVLPDSFIDIYWTGTGADVSGEVTRMIESAVRVIAVDQASDDGQMALGNARTVTVAATPEQVARLAQAQATGRLSMSLVATPEDAVAGLIQVNRNDLLGVEKQPEVQEAAAPEVCTVKTRKGDAVVEVPIPCTN